jgi:hypothetical protein
MEAQPAKRKRVFTDEQKARNRERAQRWRETHPEEHRKKSREWYAANRDAAREHQRRSKLHRKYGLTTADRDVLIASQNCQCVICGCDLKTLPERRIHIDHCHATGKVRGVLCGHCNHLLGQAKDSPEVLRKAAAYIEEHAHA